MQKNKSIFQSTDCLSQDEIQLYLNEKLEVASRHRVENHLLDCPLCAEAMEGFEAYDFEKDRQLEDLKIAINIDDIESPKMQEANLWAINRMAAAVLLLLVSTAAFFYWSAKKSEKSFLAEFESSNGLMENVRGESDFSEGREYSAGIDFYRNENYEKSLLFFDNILETQPENAMAHYFSGLSALGLGEIGKAIENLSYARFNEEKYYEQATWYLILANLEIENTEEAKALITDLLKIEGGYYSAKAEELLEKIEEK